MQEMIVEYDNLYSVTGEYIQISKTNFSRGNGDRSKD